MLNTENDYNKILYKAYLFSKIEEDFDNIIDSPVMSYENFVCNLQKKDECDIIKKKYDGG